MVFPLITHSYGFEIYHTNLYLNRLGGNRHQYEALTLVRGQLFVFDQFERKTFKVRPDNCLLNFELRVQTDLNYYQVVVNTLDAFPSKEQNLH